MKKRIIIQISLFLVLPHIITAQESSLQQEFHSIYCAEFSIEVDGFEVVDSAQIYVCCGGPFVNSTIPCKVLNRVNYESFSGRSETSYNLDENGFLIEDLLVPKKNKIAKLKELKVTGSSTHTLENNVRITIKKGAYAIDNEGKIWFEVEYLKIN